MPLYKQNYNRDRFHVEFGPPSLFERVRFKMKDVTTLYMDGVHFQTRASERNIPDEVMSRLLQFDINEWRVVTASVRDDRGKFVDSTWEIVIDGVRYWVTIGMGTFIKTSSSVMYSNNVVIIDTNKVFLYDDEKESIEEIYDLDYLKTKDDIIHIRQLLVNHLS